MTILKVEGLCKAYPEFALRDVSFSMESGSVMGFIGRNGAGKTTTLKSLLHLVHPEAGRITLLGKDMDRDEQEIRRSIGFVSGGLSYYPRKHLRQITDATRRFYPTWDEKMYRSCLERFRLSEDKRTSELSEGMKVKYQLALAMSHGAKLLILDEPTSGLDPVSRDDLLDLFLTLAEEDGVSILFSTHITSDVLAEGTPEQLTPAMERALIGLRKHRESFAGLLEAKDAALAAGCRVTQPTLEDIMVHLEREAEQ